MFGTRRESKHVFVICDQDFVQDEDSLVISTSLATAPGGSTIREWRKESLLNEIRSAMLLQPRKALPPSLGHLWQPLD